MFVGTDEYHAYRATRTATALDQRLVAMEAYVRTHPGGYWFDEVEASRKQHDTATFEQRKASREGLEHYLRVFPDGAFAEQAEARLSAIAMIEQRKAAEARQLKKARDARVARLREQRRTWVTRFLDYWGKALAGLSNWGQPIPEVAASNANFSRAFARSPRPRCTETQCIKYYDAPYGIPIVGGTRVERTMRLVLRLHLLEGKLVGAELLMPGFGFSRWYELEQRQLVVDDDPEQRAHAVAWAMEKLRALVSDFGQETSSLSDYTLPPIVALAISPTGEQIDASVDDPSAPSNRIATEALGPEQVPDMIVGEIHIGSDGRAVPSFPTVGGVSDATESNVPAPDGGGEEEVMVMDALSIPTAGSAPSGPVDDPVAGTDPIHAVEPSAGYPQLLAAAELVEAFRLGRLRVALRAAPVGQPGGHDGIFMLLDPLTPPP